MHSHLAFALTACDHVISGQLKENSHKDDLIQGCATLATLRQIIRDTNVITVASSLL